MAEEAQQSNILETVRVLRLPDTDRSRHLTQLQLWTRGRQHDHLEYDWDGYQRDAGSSYFAQRQRALGQVPASKAPFGARRPSAPSGLARLFVETFTDLLLGVGRRPKLKVAGDDDTTAAISTLFAVSNTWATLAEARSMAGSCGSAAYLPIVEEGEPKSVRLNPAELYVEWLDRTDWIPRLVIEQKVVDLARLDSNGKVVRYKVWRTRAWDEKYSYAYKDVEYRGAPANDEKDEQDDDDVIELAAAPIEHRAGRCPVVWLQNTSNSDAEEGEPDCSPEALERIDQQDRTESSLMRATRANASPTLAVSDKLQAQQMFPTRAKGDGALIQTTEAGKAYLLEINGSSIESGWTSAKHLKHGTQELVGVVIVDPETAGAIPSGVALERLERRQDAKVDAKRVPLTAAIQQIAKVWIAMLRANGIKAPGSNGAGIELPLREIKGDRKTDAPPTYQVHKLGPGGYVEVVWPGMHNLPASEKQQLVGALSQATGGRQILSQETAVGQALNAFSADTSVADEMARIEAEQKAKIDDFDRAMRDGDEEDDESVDLEGGELGAATGKVQDEALNGIQIKTMFDSLARVGDDLAPDVVAEGLLVGYPAMDRQQAAEMVAKQQAFRDTKPTPPEPAANVPPPLRPVPKPAQALDDEDEEADDEDEDEDDET